MSTAIARKSLFEIGADMLAIDAMLEETGGELATPEIEQAITAWIEELAVNEATKLSNYVSYIRQLEMEAETAKQFAQHFQAKAKTRENRIKWLKEKMRDYLQMTGRKEAHTADGEKVCVQKNGGATTIHYDELIDVEAIDQKWIKIIKKLDEDKVKAALKEGEPVPFAHYLPVGYHLRIR